MTGPEHANAAFTRAHADKWFGPMSPDEEAIPALEWPSPMSGAGADALLASINAGHMPAVSAAEATDRLIFMVEHLPDEDPDPTPTPHLDAIDALLKELTVAVLSLHEVSHEIELRHDDGQPPSPTQRKAVRVALDNLRSEIARCAYHFDPTGDPA
jgi:hypothetical protein